jgi:hypothetical protein
MDFTGFAKAALKLCKPVVTKEMKSNNKGGSIKINQPNRIWKAY